jgi:uncharacterized protein (DUF2147 family)
VKRARATPQAEPLARIEPQTRADTRARVEPAPPLPAAKAEPSPPSNAAAPAPTTTTAIAPALPPAGEPAPSQPAPAAATVVATAPASAPIQAPAATASRPAASPLGTWQTEEKKGLVRIEACGANLCGYSVDARTNQNGEKILNNMRSINDAKWTGRIHDPKSGSNYDSTIALKGADSLRVQGCAFGGLFCGGQTWSRVN